jgi:hypothetical protein
MPDIQAPVEVDRQEWNYSHSVERTAHLLKSRKGICVAAKGNHRVRKLAFELPLMPLRHPLPKPLERTLGCLERSVESEGSRTCIVVGHAEIS